MYKKSDITRFAAAILWIVVAIRYIIKIVDNTKVIKEYKESVRRYGYGSEDKAAKILQFEIFIMVCLAVISIVCAYMLVIRQLNKYGIFIIAYAVFATAIVVAVVVYLKSLLGSLSRLGSNFTVGGFLMYALMYGSIVVMGLYCKKSDEGQRYDIKIFIPVLIYLGGVLCRVIFFSSKSDGTDSLIINGFVENLIWVGILSLTGLYIYFMEKESAYIGYAGYYGYPPMGMMPGQTMGYPPMGMVPGMVPYGMMPQTKSKLELAKEQSDREFIVKKGGWICYNCKTANYSYVGSCACGMTRDASEKLEQADKDKAIAEMKERIAKSKENAASDAYNESDENAYGKEVKAGSVLEASTLKEEKKTWECLACHTINDEDVKSCKNCGQIKAMGYKNVKVLYCPSCGTMLEGGSKFCYLCGAKI